MKEYDLKHLKEVMKRAESPDHAGQFAKFHTLPDLLVKHHKFLINAAQKVLHEQKELPLCPPPAPIAPTLSPIPERGLLVPTKTPSSPLSESIVPPPPT